MAGSVFRIRTAHGTILAYARATGLVVSCRTDQFGPDYGPILAYVPPTLPHACVLFAGDSPAAPLVMDGGPAPAVLVALRVGSHPDDPGAVSLAAPHTGLFGCAAPPDATGQPRLVALRQPGRDAFEWYALVPDPAVTLPPYGLAEVAKGPLTGPAILARMQAGIPAEHAAAFLALASLLPQDQAQWLGAVILMSPPALEALQRLAPGDPWAQRALPALQASLQGAKRAIDTQIGPELDGLAAAGLNGHPASFAHRCNALARTTIAPRRTLAVLATARNEGLYVLEWVAYHRLIGAERIFLYSNDNDDGSDAMLRILAQNGIVTWVQSETGSGGAAQPKAYGHALGLVPDLLDYRWTLIIDLDEFLGFDAGRFRSATEYLDWQESQTVESIVLDWLVFGSDGQTGWTDAPITRRFTHRLPRIDMHVKSITRTNLCMQSHPHVPVFSRPGPAHVRTERGELHRPGPNPSLNPAPSAKLAWIAHYFLRSAEEFLWKNSRNRGDHALVKRLTPDLVDPAFARLFIEQHGNPANEHDDRIQRCAPGLDAEIDRLRTLPGMRQAEHEVRRRFRHAIDAIRTEIESGTAYGADHPVRAVGQLLGTAPPR